MIRQMQNFYRFAQACVASSVLLLPLGCTAPQLQGNQVVVLPFVESTSGSLRGWGYLGAKLEKDGISRKYIAHVLSDPRLPTNEPVPFGINPKESHHMYRGFTDTRNILKAREFVANYRDIFRRAEREYQVEPGVIAGILLVESGFGKVTGKERILYRLARLATIADPRNVQWNHQRLAKTDKSVSFKAVEKRAQYLNDTFYPEVLTLFKWGQKGNLDILDLRGSSAGAFGYPQFLPTSYVKFGVDGNNDGKVSLFEPEDAILSVAKYLALNGWKDDASAKGKLQILWHYNRSEPYGMTVLKVASAVLYNAPAKPVLVSTGKNSSKKPALKVNKINVDKKSSLRKSKGSNNA